MRILILLTSILLSTSLSAQRIVYSEPDKDDSRRLNFEIIGKVGGNFLIYKNIRNNSYISIYNTDMEQVDKIKQNYIPSERIINADFFPYSNHAYMVYQYQKKNVVYCMASKIDGNGKKIGDVITLDTTHLGFSSSNRIYSTISSEDKSRLMVFKINSKNKSKFVMTTVLFDQDLKELNRARFQINMEEHNDYLDEFNLDNEGDFVFARFKRNNNETIAATELFLKKAEADTPTKVEVDHKDLLLDQLHIKVDNVNRRYFLTSFYYKEKRGNVDGLYFLTWDKATNMPVLQNAISFSDELRKEAKGDANIRMAFNDYFIRNVIIKRDGGFIINSESYYTTSRYRNWNRWNYMYGTPLSSYDYYSPFSSYNSWWWRNRYDNNAAVRHHSDNITIFSFDKDGNMQWSNVIHKEQFDDEGDHRISFQLTNTGGQLHYIFNMDEKRSLLLNDFMLSPDGKMNHNPTLKNLDRGYEFLPKYGKQVSSNQLIIPCFYRNYICFAKIEFN